MMRMKIQTTWWKKKEPVTRELLSSDYTASSKDTCEHSESSTMSLNKSSDSAKKNAQVTN
uniref:Uncharacterized protein n=1 Tax=Leersia perrieri TaxID=77586 RepID=A0A0D9XE05_9ORYZ